MRRLPLLLAGAILLAAITAQGATHSDPARDEVTYWESDEPWSPTADALWGDCHDPRIDVLAVEYAVAGAVFANVTVGAATHAPSCSAPLVPVAPRDARAILNVVADYGVLQVRAVCTLATGRLVVELQQSNVFRAENRGSCGAGSATLPLSIPLVGAVGGYAYSFEGTSSQAVVVTMESVRVGRSATLWWDALVVDYLPPHALSLEP